MTCSWPEHAHTMQSPIFFLQQVFNSLKVLFSFYLFLNPSWILVSVAVILYIYIEGITIEQSLPDQQADTGLHVGIPSWSGWCPGPGTDHMLVGPSLLPDSRAGFVSLTAGSGPQQYSPAFASSSLVGKSSPHCSKALTDAPGCSFFSVLGTYKFSSVIYLAASNLR